ncbi:hypothetical protein ACIGO6_20310 [Streptomyces sp. NPDC053750]|uniref:hypothetical protein n=1 Tax=Streptomyces sp. NPDC053750 TaxID=3365714 RepID=UPI0037D74BF4
MPAGFDVDQALFEIVVAGPALNAAMRLQHDRTAADRARRAIERAWTSPDRHRPPRTTGTAGS